MTFPGWGLAPGPPPSCLHPGTSQPTSPTEGCRYSKFYDDDDDDDDGDDDAPCHLTDHLSKILFSYASKGVPICTKVKRS